MWKIRLQNGNEKGAPGDEMTLSEVLDSIAAVESDIKKLKKILRKLDQIKAMLEATHEIADDKVLDMTIVTVGVMGSAKEEPVGDDIRKSIKRAVDVVDKYIRDIEESLTYKEGKLEWLRKREYELMRKS